MLKHCYVCGTQESFLSRFSSNSDAFASELLENLEEMFPRYLECGSYQYQGNNFQDFLENDFKWLENEYLRNSKIDCKSVKWIYIQLCIWLKNIVS